MNKIRIAAGILGLLGSVNLVVSNPAFESKLIGAFMIPIFCAYVTMAYNKLKSE